MKWFKSTFWPRIMLRPVAIISILSSFLIILFQNFGSIEPTVTPSEFIGKNYVGYQAWFNIPNDGQNRKWTHWGRSGVVSSTTMTVDMWPSVGEYPTTALQDTGMYLGNGAPAKAFTSYPQEVTNLHFKWMKSYGISGAFLQWFITEPSAYRLDITKKVRASAELYGRQFSVMFDISGSKYIASCDTGPELVACVQDRWKLLVDNGITNSPQYLRVNGLPLISIWGIGFNHNANVTYNDARNLIRWFKFDAPTAYRASVLGGVDFNWRDHTGSSIADPNWGPVYAMLDIISPWSVGRYTTDSEASNAILSRAKADVDLARSRGQKYLPVIFPGFSFHNVDTTKPLNQIKRNGGQFLWAQARAFANLGLKSTYTAMFDEVDEGTAIFKVANNSSVAPREFPTVHLGIDGLSLPSDWYLHASRIITHSLTSPSLSRFESPTLPLLLSPTNAITLTTTTVAAGSTVNNGSVKLTLQTNGNLLVLNPLNQILWASNTSGRACTAQTCVAAFQTDGNLVLYQNGAPYWASGPISPNAWLAVSPVSPYLKIIATNGTTIWQTGAPAPTTTYLLLNPLTLGANQSQANPYVKLIFQSDGNLVIYNSSGSPLWATNTWGRACSSNCVAAFQNDGNLVLYQNGAPYWASNTIGTGFKLKVSPTAPVISILDSNGNAVWKQ